MMETWPSLKNAMVTVVLIVNGLVGLLCLLVAWKLWQLKRRLARAADTLTFVEQRVHTVLYPAPGFISKGQTGTQNLRQSLSQLEPQLKRIQKLMALLSLGQVVWSRRFILSQRPKPIKKTVKI